MDEKPLPWRELLEVVFRQQRMLVWSLVVCTAAGGILGLMRPPVYQAQASIMLTSQPTSGLREKAMPDRQLQAELAMLTSSSLVRSLLAQQTASGTLPMEPGRLAQARSAVTGTLRELYSRVHGTPPPDPLDRRARSIAERLRAEPVGNSNFVNVSFESTDASWAARFVNELIAHHVKRIAELSEQNEVQAFLEQQRDLLGERWQAARRELASFWEDQGTRPFAGTESEYETVLSRLLASLATAQTSVLELQARVEFLGEEIKNYPETIAAESRVTENSSVKYLESRILELQMQRGDLLSRYTVNSTPVTNLDRQLEEARQLLSTKEQESLSEVMTAVNPSHQTLEVDLVTAKTELTAARARVEALQLQIKNHRENLAKLINDSAEHERLVREVEAAKEAYELYQGKEEEARFANAIDRAGNVNLIMMEAAEVPLEPLPAARSRLLVTGALVGLLLGVVLSFARDYWDPTLKSTAQAKRLSGLQIVGEIPQA